MASAIPVASIVNCDSIKTTNESGVKVYAQVRGLDADSYAQSSSCGLPILVLIHGYPQSSYLYRYVVPLLPKNVPLYIPDLPGYGNSTHPSIDVNDFSKRSIGIEVLTALLSHITPSQNPHKIILLGHDRGARVCHRLAVDFTHHPSSPFETVFKKFELVGTVLVDIMPTTVQYSSFSNPPSAASAFHWPFLAAPAGIPEKMILATGGEWWCDSCITRWAGKNPHGRARVLEGLLEYTPHFLKESVVVGTCLDYRAGAGIDIEFEKMDRNMGYGIGVGKVLVLFTRDYLGSRYDVKGIWAEWVEGGEERLSVVSVGDGYGHFLPEEAPTETVGVLLEWIKKDVGIEI